jgi:hypothetical protein
VKRRRALILVAAAWAVGLASPLARADQLTLAEIARLDAGQTVTRKTTIDRGPERYVGGVTYAVVETSADDLASILDDVGAYEALLPRTKRARLVGEDAGRRFIELWQGNALVTTSYTLRVEADRPARELRFWLDPTKPHQMRDAWGFFRYAPWRAGEGSPARVLLTYGILVDFGPGIVRDLFEERLRGLLLSVPELVQRYVSARVKRG